MTQMDRIMLVVVILLADMLIFMLPLSAFFAAYILLARPAWFKEWILRMYE